MVWGGRGGGQQPKCEVTRGGAYNDDAMERKRPYGKREVTTGRGGREKEGERKKRFTTPLRLRAMQ